MDYKTITISKKDIKDFSFSDSGQVIDELAYCANQWTSNDLMENNWGYEPNEPYMFNYEQDLLENTKTADQLYNIASILNVSLNANWERLADEQGLQAGACLALNNEQLWNKLLEAYEYNLQSNGTESFSDNYNKELQDAILSFNDDPYEEWLNGDHRDFTGVVYEIAKYFTDERDGSYDQKNDTYAFTLNDTDIENYKDQGYRINQIKKALLSDIKASGNARKSKDQAENEKRKAERERLAQYKKEQAEQAEKERKEKLLAMKKN